MSSEVVIFSGGSGGGQLARALKPLVNEGEVDPTFIVGTWDSGGSTAQYLPHGVMPPGSHRKAIAALAADEQYAELLNYRFEDIEDDTGLGIHSKIAHVAGNSIIAAMEKLSDSPNTGLAAVCKLFDVPESVAFRYATVTPTTLSLERDASRVVGEAEVAKSEITDEDDLHNLRLFVRNGSEEHEPAGDEGVIEAVYRADAVIIGPGALASVAPFFLIPDVGESLRASSADSIFIANATVNPLQLPHLTLSGMVRVYEELIADGFRFDTVVAHKPNDTTVMQDRLLAIDIGTTQEQQVITEDLLVSGRAPGIDSTGTPRFNESHNPEKLRNVIRQIIMENRP